MTRWASSLCRHQARETQLFGLGESTTNGSTITDINTLVTGLSAEYGEDGFMTELNRTRERFLENSNYAYFAESEFSLGLNGDTSFSTKQETWTSGLVLIRLFH